MASSTYASHKAPAAASSPPVPIKPMSNRLLTMKFMQRAAASSPHSKSETAAIKAAAKEENARREAATFALRPRNTAESADKDIETRWELSYVADKRKEESALRVIDVGFSELTKADREDATEEEEDEEEKKEAENAGRLVFGNFRKKGLETPAVATKTGSDDDGSDSENEEEAEEEGGRRRRVDKRDPLRGLTSISNAGNQQFANMKCRVCGKQGHKAADCAKAECYACGGLGHMSNDCPNPRSKRKESDGRHDSRPKKPRRSM